MKIRSPFYRKNKFALLTTRPCASGIGYCRCLIVFMMSLLCTHCFGDRCINYDFESAGTEMQGTILKNGAILSSTDNVISGKQSLLIKAQWDPNNNWHKAFESRTLKAGKRYYVSLKHRILNLTQPNSAKLKSGMFLCAESNSGSGLNKGRTVWAESNGQVQIQHKSMTMDSDVNDYRLVVGIYGGGCAVIDDIKIEPLPDIDISIKEPCPTEEPYEPYGMCVHFSRLSERWGKKGFTNKEILQGMGLLKKAGIQWIRVLAGWGEIEPNEGVIDTVQLQRVDYILECADSFGIKSYLHIGYPSRWSSSNPEVDTFWAYPPRDLNKWKHFVRLIAQHFKDRVHFWEIGNEPDWHFWQGNMPEYVAFLKTAYKTLKTIDPNNRVIMGGLAFNGTHAWEMLPGAEEYALDKMYKAGVKGYFDIFAIHPYSHDIKTGTLDSIDSINNAMEIMKRYGDDNKPVWLTEIGASSNNDSPEKLEFQADYLQNIFTEVLLHPQVEKVFWYNFRCKTGEGNVQNNFGIVSSDFTLRPAFDRLCKVKKTKTKLCNPQFYPQEHNDKLNSRNDAKAKIR